MNKLLTVVTAVCFATTAFAADKGGDKAAARGEDAFKALLGQIDAALSKHDAKAITELYADDATFVGPVGDGAVLKGKAEILKQHEGMFKGPFGTATSKHTLTASRMIGKDAAFIDATVEWTGMKMDMPAGAPVPSFHVVSVLVNKGGKWTMTDTRPYFVNPMPPPPAAAAPAPAAAPAAAPAKK